MHLSTPYCDMDSLTQQKSRKSGERLFKTTKSSSIPHLTDLRKELGYGHPGEDQDIAFKRAIRKQIEEFESTEKLQGYRFTKWRTPDHQRGLLEITRDFLDTKGKGPEFWPDTPNSASTRPLQYSKDYVKIHRLMIKVFWRSAREYKRHKSSSTAYPLLSQSSNLTDQIVKTQENSSDTDNRILYKTPDVKGQSADNPIDLDDMSPYVEGVSESNAPYFGHIPSSHDDDFDGLRGEDLGFEPVVSDLLEEATNRQAFEPLSQEGLNNAGLYMPTSSPTMEQNVQGNGKRPSEPSYDRPAKIPRHDDQSSEPTDSQAGEGSRSTGHHAATSRPATRTSARQTKPVLQPNSASEEEVAPYDESSSSQSQSQHSNYSDQGQEATGSRLKTPTSHPGRSNLTNRSLEPVETTRARAARLAAVEAEAAGVTAEQTPVAEKAVGLAARTQEHILAALPRHTSLPQSNPSREQEAMQESMSERPASAPQAEGSQDPPQRAVNRTGYIQLNRFQRTAVQASHITLQSNISNGISFRVWNPSSSIFDMTLSDVARALGLGTKFGSLYLLLEILISERHDEYVRIVQHDDEAEFERFKRYCLSKIAREFQLTESVAVMDKPALEYSILFSKTPFRLK